MTYPFVCLCVTACQHEWEQISVSQLQSTHMERISPARSQTPPPQWKAPASYLADIILITETYGRGLCSINSVLTGSVPEQHNTMTHPLRLGVITATFSVCTVHSWQKAPYIFKMLIKRLAASLGSLWRLAADLTNVYVFLPAYTHSLFLYHCNATHREQLEYTFAELLLCMCISSVWHLPTNTDTHTMWSLHTLCRVNRLSQTPFLSVL